MSSLTTSPIQTAPGAADARPARQLRSDPPAAILDGLRQLGVDARDLIIASASDIDLTGRYVRQWVLASRSTLWLFDEGDARAPTLTLAFAETQEFRTFAVYGSGLLQAKVGGIWLDL